MGAVRGFRNWAAKILLVLTAVVCGAVKPMATLKLAPLESRDSLVRQGERWWKESPDASNPVACATCHDEGVAIRAWAPSFPKWKPLPAPNARVMTLLQANAEAVARHYRVKDPRPAAIAITAYLSWLAGGAPVSPGKSTGQPVFAARLEALSASVERGRHAFAASCNRCHQVQGTAPRVLGFPRVVGERAESLEGFLEQHASRPLALAWDGAPMADLVAYFMSTLAGARFPSPASFLEVSR